MTARSVVRLRWLTLVLTLAPLTGLQAFEPHCHPQTLCTTGAGGCIPLPIGLPSVDELQRIEGDGYTLGNRCGTTGKTPCGKYLAKDVCPDGGICECGPGHPPCETGTFVGPVVAGAGALASEANPPRSIAEYQTGMGALAPAPETAAIHERLARLRDQVPPSIAQLWDRLARAGSVYLKASAQVWRSVQEEVVQGTGSYEYWEQGGGYRAVVDLPASLGLVRVREMASDGILRQMFLADMGTITVSQQDTRMMALALDNPLVLPLSFLLPSFEDCPHCELRLSDLRTVRPTARRGAGSRGDLVRFSDDVLHEVRLADPYGEVASIESREPGGRLLRRVSFTDYQPVLGADWRFPRTVRLELAAATGAAGAGEPPELVIAYVIERLELDPDLDRSTFQIPWEQAERVWDDERQTFVRRRTGPEARSEQDRRRH